MRGIGHRLEGRRAARTARARTARRRGADGAHTLSATSLRRITRRTRRPSGRVLILRRRPKTLRGNQPRRHRRIGHHTLPIPVTHLEHDILVTAPVIHHDDGPTSVKILHSHGIKLIRASCVAFIPIAENAVVDGAAAYEPTELPDHVVIVGLGVGTARVDHDATQAARTPAVRAVRTVLLVRSRHPHCRSRGTVCDRRDEVAGDLKVPSPALRQIVRALGHELQRVREHGPKIRHDRVIGHGRRVAMPGRGVRQTALAARPKDHTCGIDWLVGVVIVRHEDHAAVVHRLSKSLSDEVRRVHIRQVHARISALVIQRFVHGRESVDLDAACTEGVDVFGEVGHHLRDESRVEAVVQDVVAAAVGHVEIRRNEQIVVLGPPWVRPGRAEEEDVAFHRAHLCDHICHCRAVRFDTEMGEIEIRLSLVETGSVVVVRVLLATQVGGSDGVPHETHVVAGLAKEVLKNLGQGGVVELVEYADRRVGPGVSKPDHFLLSTVHSVNDNVPARSTRGRVTRICIEEDWCWTLSQLTC